MSSSTTPKVALVCDWLTTVGGAEQVLRSIHEVYPHAPIYTSKYTPQHITWFNDADVRTGWLQFFPASLRRFLGPLRQHYFNHLDLSDYDIVISVTGAEAKSVQTTNFQTGKHALHFCYCHIPTQYYWSKYDDYLANPGFGFLNPLARLGLKLFVRPLRRADYRAAQHPDYYITISQYSASQIKTYYKRESIVIHPPVAVEKFQQVVENSSTKNTTKVSKSQAKNVVIKQHKNTKSQTNFQPNNKIKLHFVNYSRQVSWKRLDLAIKACLQTGHHLTLIGDGPEHSRLVRLAQDSPLIQFYPTMPQPQLLSFLQQSDAFIFPSLEPFGIAPVEALAAGCPVIAYVKGGAQDYIQNHTNGCTFPRQTVSSLVSAIREFAALQSTQPFNRLTVSRTVHDFSDSRFKRQLEEYIHAQV